VNCGGNICRTGTDQAQFNHNPFSGGRMPHLQFEINRPVPDAAKVALAQRVRELFAGVMDTGTDHISISIRECALHDLSLGRVKEPEKGIALIDADVRAGRTIAQRRQLALRLIGLLQELLNIPPEHVYITYTEHPGEDFHLSDRYLADWQEDEDQLKN
jgi:phenylpyruvate tautomerase PptA (4-oxalocrotonate tautomerase family)